MVIEGSGILQSGGKLVNTSRPSPHDQRGSALDGGTSRKVAKGDIFVVPAGVPHWFSEFNGKLVLLSLHVPRREVIRPEK